MQDDANFATRLSCQDMESAMSSPIEDYGLIGDGETAALVRRDGSIDWFCWPRFDSDACFAALVGTPANGRWRVGPAMPCTTRRRYWEDTLILETEHESETGIVRVIDFMPMRDRLAASGAASR
jgi:GH15 family glucan-1,4-alpha-glucosidase